MQKLLEVTINDQGNLDIQSDNEQILDEYVTLNDLKKAKVFFDKLLVVMVDRMWKDRNTGISKIVRLLSMAEICACAEPYAQIEELWSTIRVRSNGHSRLGAHHASDFFLPDLSPVKE